jgi:hypothetical protein
MWNNYKKIENQTWKIENARAAIDTKLTTGLQ